MLIQGPAIGRDEFSTLCASDILLARERECHDAEHLFLSFRPIAAQRNEVARKGTQAFRVGIRVLHDQPRNPFWMTARDAKADGAAEIECVENESMKAQLFAEAFDEVG